jgi:hypothetical protein
MEYFSSCSCALIDSPFEHTFHSAASAEASSLAPRPGCNLTGAPLPLTRRMRLLTLLSDTERRFDHLLSLVSEIAGLNAKPDLSTSLLRRAFVLSIGRADVSGGRVG